MENNRLSVSQFNNVIDIQLGSLGEFEIEGELVSFSISQRQGVFMTMKDTHEQALLEITGYKPSIEGIDLVEEGMKVVVFGTPKLYSPNGRFSLAIRKISPEGEGALQKAFEKLKSKLESDGLFDITRKRPLPRIIERVALLTGKGSAAYSDFVKIIAEHNAAIDIDFYPIHVQGDRAVLDILTALNMAEQSDVDCIIMVRGGGSLEDLIAFNDESIARELFGIRVPTIVGIGHERDECIAEYVADKRASTPSQAAYYLIDNNSQLIVEIFEKATQAENIINGKLQLQKLTIERMLDYMTHKVERPLMQAEEVLRRVSNIDQKLIQIITERLQRVEYTCSLIKSYNPMEVIKRGYAIVRHNGVTVRSIAQTPKDAEITGTLVDGDFNARII